MNRTRFSKPTPPLKPKSGWGGQKPFKTSEFIDDNEKQKKLTYKDPVIQQQLSCVEYIPNFIPNATELYNQFLNDFNFEDRTVYLDNGKSYQLNRATCIFGDADILDAPPKIWGADNPIVPWTPELLTVKTLIENYTGKKYNICLCNYYKDGTKTIGWHSDREEKGSVSSIASISLCPEYDRLFQLRKIGDEMITFDYILGNGSLFLMKDGCQENYQHWLPPDPKCNVGRINLTFRLFDKFRYGQI